MQSSVFDSQLHKMLYSFILEFFTTRVIDVHCECWTWWHTITAGIWFIVCVLWVLTAYHWHRIHFLCIVSVDSIPLAQDTLFVYCECWQHTTGTGFIVCWDCWQQNTSTGVHIFLEDTSSNGTFVNGEKVGECPWCVAVWRVPWVGEWV